MVRLIHTLKQADIFYRLTLEQLERIANLGHEQAYQAGEIVFDEGSLDDSLFIIIEGEVEILVNPGLVARPDTQEVQRTSIAILRRGQSFGEMALVDRGIRSATVRAVKDETLMLVLPGSTLLELCNSDPALGYQLMRNLVEDLALKMRSSGLRIREDLLYGGKI